MVAPRFSQREVVAVAAGDADETGNLKHLVCQTTVPAYGFEGDEVAQAVVNFMMNQPERMVNGQSVRTWSGTASDLLAQLNN